MIHATMRTAGNLYPDKERHPTTLRPPPPSCQELAHTRATLEQLSEMVALRTPSVPKVTMPRTFTMLPPMPAAKLVAQAIIAALEVDLSQDHAYMPFEGGTTLREAHNFLQLNGYILIQGGRIQPEVLGWSLILHGQVQPIDYQDVCELLALYYPDPHKVVLETHDTLPCPAPRPLPLPGVGLYAQVTYGRDIDFITDQEWKGATFPRGIHQQALYVGDLTLDDSLWDVWWSLPLGMYICQQVPQEELLARRAPIPAEES
jgi:hypothetical protein